MSPDWKALAPHRPLEPGALEYVPPPSRLGETIADRVRAGGSTILVGGPAGVGKSTELARAAQLLEQDRFVCLIQVDRTENMRRLTVDRLLWCLTGRVLSDAARRNLEVSRILHAQLSQSMDPSPVVGKPMNAVTLTRATLTEVTRVSRRAVTLLLDGMEKVPEGSEAGELFEALGDLSDEVEFVVVVPWHFAFGPNAAQVVRPGERLLTAQALPTDSEGTASFFRAMLESRLGDFDPDFSKVADEAIGMSGGLPRMFLQLVADAATYANLGRRGTSGWPSRSDLERAAADMAESLKRMLLPGDREELRRFDGHDGIELDPARKVRLMAHGLLLERVEGTSTVLRPHPLLPLESSVRAA